MISIGLDVPKSFTVHTLDDAKDVVKEIGLPVIIRASFTLGGTGGGIAYNYEEFEDMIRHGLAMSPVTEVLLEESIQSPSAHDHMPYIQAGQSQPTQHTQSPTLATVGAPVMGSENAEDAATRQLIQAASQGRMDEVIQALEADARIDENRASFVGVGRQSPLLAATLLGHHRIVRVLLERGANPMIPEKDGYTVWHAAAFQGRTEVLRVLHELEVPGYAPSETDGYSPLHRAAWGSSPGHVEAVKFLIGPGGRPCDVVAADGKTPLQMAVHKDTITALKACMDVAE